MKRRGRPPDQGNLDFDLPLRPKAPAGPPGEIADAGADPGDRAEARDLPLFPEAPEPPEEPSDEGASGEPPEQAGASGGELEESVTFGVRVLGALADLAVHGGVLVLAILGQSFLGLASSAQQAPAYAVFLLAFSFLYCVVPMAFWGQTPGMASLGLVVRAADGENLTFPQTALRWLAAVATLLFLGLPLLLATSGRSLGDRWSRSRTHRYRS